MLKSFYLSLACAGIVCSLFASNANEEIARGEDRGGGGHRDDNHDYNRNDQHRNDHHEYDRYDNHSFYDAGNRNSSHGFYDGHNHYDQNHWNNDRGAYNEGIYDGVLLNNTYNPDVQYTPPGSTDNFNQVYEQNQQ